MARFDRRLGARVAPRNGIVVPSRYSAKNFGRTLFLRKRSVRLISNSTYTDPRALRHAISDYNRPLFLNTPQRTLLRQRQLGSSIAAALGVIRKSLSFFWEEMIHFCKANDMSAFGTWFTSATTQIRVWAVQATVNSKTAARKNRFSPISSQGKA